MPFAALFDKYMEWPKQICICGKLGSESYWWVVFENLPNFPVQKFYLSKDALTGLGRLSDKQGFLRRNVRKEHSKTENVPLVLFGIYQI